MNLGDNHKGDTMINWNDEPAFRNWQYLFHYRGKILGITICYKFDEYPDGCIRIKLKDEDAGWESYVIDGLRNIDEAEAYLEQYKEKLKVLSVYERQLEFD